MPTNLTLQNGIEVTLDFGDQLNLSLAPSGDGMDFTTDVGTIVERGTKDYEELENLPSIESVTLIGDHTIEQLGVNAIGNAAILDLFR